MDVKMAFLNGTLKEEQALKAWYDELSTFLISKGFTKDTQKHEIDKCDSIGTPMATKLKLDAYMSGTPVNQTRSRSMIGSLMYLTSSRPDIVQAVERSIVELYFVINEYQLVDMFTKALSQARFEYLVGRLGIRCLTPAELEVLENETA
ncbi:hypothetical protein Tco_1427342 [Tanacetum coccineum]